MRDSTPVAVRSAIAEGTGEVNHVHAPRKPCGTSNIYQQPCPSLCAPCAVLVSTIAMSADRIATALARIEAATARIDSVRDIVAGVESAAGGSARVVELVNVHEKLREQVAESLRELDDLLARLED